MDYDLKKAFNEMQINKFETSKKVKMIDIQSDVVKTSKQKHLLTERGTNDLNDETRIYSSIGRMFVLTNITQKREELKSKQEACDSIINQLNEKKQFLLKNLKEQEDGLRERVQQIRAADSK